MKLLRSNFLPVLAALAAVCLSIHAADRQADDDHWGHLKWVNGPATGKLEDVATLRVPEGFRFTGKKGAEEFSEAGGGDSDGSEVGLLDSRAGKWKVLFEFDEIGYVKDDEKADLSKKSDELLDSYRKGVESMNKRRKSAGAPPMEIVGWHVPPQFNDQTKQLEWSIAAQVAGEKFVNYNVRVLGRKGVMRVILIEDFEKIDATLPRFRDVMKEFSYNTGGTYAEYKQGDKVAKMGLSALVLGGAAAAAYKVGLFGAFFGFIKKFIKLVIAAVVAVGIAIKNLFSRMFGRRQGADSQNV